MATTDTVTSASLLGNVTRYEDAKQTANSKSTKEMGKQDFLTLFTAQLKNQNPLDPVKNEAFVAQLAQFSQLEALTNMQTSMDNLVTTMAGERMLGGSSLIGLKVAVPDTLSRLDQGGNIEGKIDLPQGAASSWASTTSKAAWCRSSRQVLRPRVWPLSCGTARMPWAPPPLPASTASRPPPWSMARPPMWRSTPWSPCARSRAMQAMAV